MDEEYDCIVLGTGLKECIISEDVVLGQREPILVYENEAEWA